MMHTSELMMTELNFALSKKKGAHHEILWVQI